MGTAGEQREGSPQSGVHTPPDGGQAIWFQGNRMTIKATAQSTAGAYGLIESWLAAGFSPHLHIHRREDESFWVLDGELTMRCGDRTFRASRGSYVFLPRGVPHTFVVEGQAPARLLTLLTPGGAEGFFVEVGRPAEHDERPPVEPPDVDRLTRAAEKFGAEIVGPAMTPATHS